MPQPRVTKPVSLIIAALWLAAAFGANGAQNSLKVIDNPSLDMSKFYTTEFLPKT